MRGSMVGGFLLAAAVVAVGCSKDAYISPTGILPVATPTPTAGPPTPTPTPVLQNVVVNGDFETGNLTPWFICYVQHHQGNEVDPNPVQSPSAFTSPTPGPDTAPLAAASQLATDASIQSTTPSGNAYAGTYAALVGYSALVSGAYFREAGASGICQNIAIPAASTPQLTLEVYEGTNNVEYNRNDQEAAVFASSAGLTSANNSTTTLPVQTLFAENNCYNNLGLHNTTADETPCNPGGSLANGEQWRQKGPYNLSAYAGQTITLFLGTWSNTGGTGTAYINWAYFDNVVIAGAGSAASPSPSPSSSPSPSGSPTATLGSVILSTSAMSFLGTGSANNQSFSVTQTNYSGTFTVTNGSPSCSGIATASGTSPSFTVTPVAVGHCVLTVTGGNSQTASLTIDVSSTTFGGQSERRHP
jgi:hypothetical protein